MSSAAAAELADFLAAHPQVQAAQLLLTDPSGVVRGKSVRVHELQRIFTDGRPVAGSILGLDITGEDVDATGLVWDTGDADMICRPVPRSLVLAPWIATPTAQLMLSMYTSSGAAAAADPRHALAAALERLRARGYTAVLACEIEFYLLREQDGGAANPLLLPAGGGRASERHKIDAYSLTRLDDLAPLFDEVFAAAQAQGLPAETLMSEYAPGQFEITLTHRADALRAVDEAVMFKRLLKGVAAKHGYIASFMAKPFAERSGSGLHLHISLADRDGANCFAAADPAGSLLCRHAIGGLRQTMAESFLAFAPNANSYRRFRAQSYAPTAAIWGINNRSVSLRVPSGPPASRHVEHRIAGADANLYVAATAVLAGVAHGIEQQIDPGPPTEGNGYLQSAPRELPQTWQEAIDRAAASKFLAAALGPGFLDIYVAIKRQECERFSAQVTELDYSWYLRAV